VTERFHVEYPSDEDVNILFSIMDADSDGKISKD
jgi:Ca2+-binding EF-hand superfamily protein